MLGRKHKDDEKPETKSPVVEIIPDEPLPAPPIKRTHLDELVEQLNGPGDMSWSARHTLYVALKEEIAKLRSGPR